jgi:hypothetical protein
VDTYGFWWHLWHDPMRDNLWSVLALAVILAALGLLVWYWPWRRKP